VNEDYFVEGSDDILCCGHDMCREVTIFCVVDMTCDVASEKPTDFIFCVLEKLNYAIRLETEG
jgi:hypothetical protein